MKLIQDRVHCEGVVSFLFFTFHAAQYVYNMGGMQAYQMLAMGVFFFFLNLLISCWPASRILRFCLRTVIPLLYTLFIHNK